MKTITHGESIFIDFKYANGVIPSGYGGAWQILLNDSVVAEGVMNVSTDGTTLELRIPSSVTAPLRGSYRLLVSVKNDTTGYCDYILNDILNVN